MHLTGDREAIAWHGPSTTYGGSKYGEMIVALRQFLRSLASARPDSATINDLASDLKGWKPRLDAFAVDEANQVYARRADLVGRAQATWPAITFTHVDDEVVEGYVCFDRYFLGRNGVVHGGAITMIFDEATGYLANSGNRTMGRTVNLTTNFRAPAPIEVDLQLTVRFLREEGRKRFLHVALHHGETLCAEADALMITLLPGQK